MALSHRVRCLIAHTGIGDAVGDDLHLLSVCKGQISTLKLVRSGVRNGRVGSNLRLRLGFRGWCAFGVDG
jgi:hypothetical protein